MEKVVAPLCVMSLGLCFSLWGAIRTCFEIA